MSVFATTDACEYVQERTVHRVLGTAALFGLALPPVASFVRMRYIMAWPTAELPWLLRWWLPTGHGHAAALGAIGGCLEDIHASLAFKSASQLRSAREPEMWTPRTLSPCFAFFLNPALACCCLDGEMKGTDCALAIYEERRIQSYPFFAVLDPLRPSAPGATCRYKVHTGAADDWTLLTHLLTNRIDGGFYEVERHPKNEPWRIL